MMLVQEYDPRHIEQMDLREWQKSQAHLATLLKGGLTLFEKGIPIASIGYQPVAWGLEGWAFTSPAVDRHVFSFAKLCKAFQGNVLKKYERVFYHVPPGLTQSIRLVKFLGAKPEKTVTLDGVEYTRYVRC